MVNDMTNKKSSENGHKMARQGEQYYTWVCAKLEHSSEPPQIYGVR